MAVLDEDGYEIVRRDTRRNEHGVAALTSINDVARDLIIWLAAHCFPGPANQADHRHLKHDQAVKAVVLVGNRLNLTVVAHLGDRAHRTPAELKRVAGRLRNDSGPL
ncbi:hypothetical protein [Streptomyces cadmiisoli]|uniref:hypothetical protein n=1 Tax=Streptomyces cadmiisoli TaxID=2184053 RepID=UPI0013A6CCDB|nr:hypothetical protein [Streptomyces cadmiisoli]